MSPALFLIVAGLVLAGALAPPLAAALRQERLSAMVTRGTHWGEKILRAHFLAAALAGLAMAVIQLGALLARNIFAVNFIWLQESVIYLFGVMVLASAGALLILDAHVRVDVFFTRLSAKAQRRVDLFGLYAFVLPVALLIVIAAGPYVTQSWATLEGSSEPSGIPAVFLLKSLIPWGGALIGLAVPVRAAALLDLGPAGR